jgi:putative transposase
MTNHVHLLMTPAAPRNASELMRHLNLRFVHLMNRKYGRTGSGWEGRFWSSIVETGAYFIRCQRYIELNPVRAGLVKNPAKYPWSSHACNAFGTPSSIVEPHAEYLALGGNDVRRRAAYRALFLEGLDDAELGAIRQAARSSLPYGSEAFIRELESTLQRPMTRGRPGPRGRVSRLPPAA